MNAISLFAVLTCAAFALFIQPSAATPGDLDLTFGGTGKVTTAIGNGDDIGYGVAVQSDGKIVVAGHSFNGSNNDFAITRYNTDGTLDVGFGTGGKVITAFDNANSEAIGVTVQNDGKIVAAGYSDIGGSRDFALVRYQQDGSLDTTFNSTGNVTTDFGANETINGIALQTDGKIVTVGYSYTGSTLLFAVARYHPNGNLDTTFNETGKVTTVLGTNNDVAQSVVVQNDGRIVVAGNSSTLSNTPVRYALVRYNADGSLDTTFNGTGKVITIIRTDHDVGRSVALQSNGKIVVAGESWVGSDKEFGLARYNTNGSLDTSFNGTGKVTTSIGTGDVYVSSMALQANGKIVVAGTSDSPNGGFALMRFNPEGSVDTGFNGTGKVITNIGNGCGSVSMTLQNDGKIVAAGYASNGSNYDFAVIRFLGDEILDGESSIRIAAEYRFTTANGISYRIEASTDFTHWSTIETNILGTGSVLTRFYSIEGQPRRFFRSRRN